MNTKKNRGDIYFVTPSWEGVTKLLSAVPVSIERNTLAKAMGILDANPLYEAQAQ